ncbi:YbhB/YbcL family Raf kinase inhibitor-like protein [Kitasatospora camelliae]|uniref:YbhB/YbcL family Raf kinase inhibitor-like protein n=1 Tax=Kitasatospora camelliae TaxID=3156397 RepID=A0AAU8JXH9_9ACTN
MTARPPLPYDFLPPVPSFQVTSRDLTDGATMPDEHVYAKGNLSPHLAWSGFPDTTQGFAVTCYDPDAPTGSGWWHWLALDLPATATELTRGAGSSDHDLPGHGFHARNDFPGHRYDGAAPPPGPAHRYVFVVHALDVPSLGLKADTPAAVVGFHLSAHAVGRAMLVVEYAAG